MLKVVHHKVHVVQRPQRAADILLQRLQIRLFKFLALRVRPDRLQVVPARKQILRRPGQRAFAVI